MQQKIKWPKQAVFQDVKLDAHACNRASDQEQHRQSPDAYLSVLNLIFMETE